LIVTVMKVETGSFKIMM